MKKIKIYQENDGGFVMERINQFNHSFKKYLDSHIEVLERLREYAKNGEDYKVIIKIDDRHSQQVLESFCDRTDNLKPTTWKGREDNQVLSR